MTASLDRTDAPPHPLEVFHIVLLTSSCGNRCMKLFGVEYSQVTLILFRRNSPHSYFRKAHLLLPLWKTIDALYTETRKEVLKTGGARSSLMVWETMFFSPIAPNNGKNKLLPSTVGSHAVWNINIMENRQEIIYKLISVKALA